MIKCVGWHEGGRRVLVGGLVVIGGIKQRIEFCSHPITVRDRDQCLEECDSGSIAQ